MRFRSNFIQSLNAKHPKWCKSSRSGGQRSRLRRAITCAKNSKIINNSAGDSSISLKFRTDFDACYACNVPQTFKVKSQKSVVTGQGHSMPYRMSIENAIFQALEYVVNSRKSNLVKIIPERSATLKTCSKS